jgi:predicted Zn-dependent protease
MDFLLRRISLKIRHMSAAALLVCCAAPFLMAPSLAIAQSLPSLGDTEREYLSPQMERKLGERIMREIRSNRDYLDDAPLQEYLSGVGNSLLAAKPEARGEMQYDFFFFAVRDPVLNAFALPGGYIGVHSGLILAAQSESELASVLAHEIGHVAQRHIARMLGNSKQDTMISLASLILGALAASASPDAGMGIMMGGQGLAVQRQLDFSRDAEREADRVGLDILNKAGYETTGMVSFFGRLQQATRAYSDAVPPYLRSHPLTTERMADIEARTRSFRYRQHADSLDFALIQARVRVLQDLSTQGLRDASDYFQRQLMQNAPSALLAAKYGSAFVALKQGDATRAQARLDEARAMLKQSFNKPRNVVLDSLGLDIRMAAHQYQQAVAEADTARNVFPFSRGIAHQYADALIAVGRSDQAAAYLRDQIQLYREDRNAYQLLAKACNAQGMDAQQHMALAEYYALGGSLPAALDQLSIARRAPDASFYDLSIIDGRERDLRAQRLEELKQEKEGWR